MKFKKACVCLLIAAATVNLSRAGALQGQLDSVFGSMTNLTSPGAYMTQRRGVVGGGSVTVKNRVVDTNLLSVSAPSWKMGCGGIDLYAGSFSYINKEQFIQLMRSVAANAVGYSFRLALDTVCPECMAQINSLTNMVNQLNQFDANSCQLAQGIVNDVASSFGQKRNNDASLAAMASGLFSDSRESRSPQEKDSASEALRKNDPAKYQELYGNVVYQVLEQRKAWEWFPNLAIGKDQEALEAIMGMTGTLIVSKKGDGSDETDVQYLPATIGLEELVDGGKVKGYQCQNKTCDKVKMVELPPIQSLRNKIYRMLVGDGTNAGIIHKYAAPLSGVSFTSEEKSLLEHIPASTGALLRNVSMKSESAGKEFATEIASHMAIQMSFQLIDDVLQAVKDLLPQSKIAEVDKVANSLDQKSRNLYKEYERLMRQSTSATDIFDRYWSMQPAIENKDVQINMHGVGGR